MVNFKTGRNLFSSKIFPLASYPSKKNHRICFVLTSVFLIYLIVAGVASAPARAAYMFASDTDDGFLKKINQTTGVAIDVGLIGPPASVHIRGLSASPYPTILYGAETNNYKLWTIDVTTGEGSSFEDPFGFNIRELAYDPINDVLYGTDYSKLYTVNQSTGVATFVGIFGSGITEAWALDYDTVTGRIYGVDGDLDQLFWVNPSTGAATLIGDTERDSISDIAFDWQSGNLYGIETLQPSDYFFAVDKKTGATTDIGPMGEPIYVKGLAKPIPEPTTFLLLGSGLLGLVWLVRKKSDRG